MSEETKKDLQRQIDEEENTITACNARAADLRKALSLIKDKPKLRHGDYGPNENMGQINMMLRRYAGDTFRICGSSCLGDDTCTTRLSEVQGNIFDDLKAAGPGGILLPLTKEEVRWIDDHRDGESYFWIGPAVTLQNKVRAKLK